MFTQAQAMRLEALDMLSGRLQLSRDENKMALQKGWVAPLLIQGS